MLNQYLVLITEYGSIISCLMAIYIFLYSPDGLNLSIDYDHRIFSSFEINGAKHALRFPGGKIIHAGMNERALKEIFPVPYSKKTTLTDNVINYEKTLVRVYL